MRHSRSTHTSGARTRRPLPLAAAFAAVLALLCIVPRTSRGAESECGRACLAAVARAYWAALLAHDPARLPQAPQIVFTENNVRLPLGRGLWRTVSSAGPQDIVFAEVSRGEVATTAQITEGSRPALLLARLKVVDRRVTELETLVARRETTTFLRPEGWHDAEPLLMRDLEPAARRSRAALVAVAEAYFDRLPDPSRPVPPLDPGCNRVENGVRTTNNPDPFPGVSPAPLNPAVSRLSCAEQFASKSLSFVTRVRDRRYPLVDEEKGLVLAWVLFDHDGAAPASRSGTKLSSALPSPYSYTVAELFKIADGRILQIQAVFCLLPYGMRSAWP